MQNPQKVTNLVARNPRRRSCFKSQLTWPYQYRYLEGYHDGVQFQFITNLKQVHLTSFTTRYEITTYKQIYILFAHYTPISKRCQHLSEGFFSSLGNKQAVQVCEPPLMLFSGYFVSVVTITAVRHEVAFSLQKVGSECIMYVIMLFHCNQWFGHDLSQPKKIIYKFEQLKNDEASLEYIILQLAT